MKVYLQPPQPSRGLDRIATALRRYAPSWVEVCEFPRNVDLTVIYVIGRRDAVQRQVAEILSRNKKYAIVQCCLLSTMNPDVRDWIEIWKNAQVLWSYYDLFRIALDDGLYIQGMDNFYHAPLGADAQVFYPRPESEWFDGMVTKPSSKFTIASSGLSRLSESVRECALAVNQVDGYLFHLGPVFTGAAKEVRANGVSDNRLAGFYSGCEFVSGLRRKEGFELPAVEGLLCGARPIVFDSVDYRWNYGNHAEYLYEGARQEVIDQLVELFKRGARPVTAEEREQAVERFNWETIIGGFYERLR